MPSIYKNIGNLPGWIDGDYGTPSDYYDLLRKHNDGPGDILRKETWVNFDRFYTIDLNSEVPSTRHYVFICRPDLYLVDTNNKENKLSVYNEQTGTGSGVGTDGFFTMLNKLHPEIIASLTGDFAGYKIGGSYGSAEHITEDQVTVSGYGNTAYKSNSTLQIGQNNIDLPMHAFIPYLSNRIEGLSIPDYTIKTNQITQPYTKYTIPYTTTAIESNTGGTFDMVFREDKNYSIHKLFYAWIYYQDGVMRNMFRPKEKYLMYNALDYATSIYDILVDQTGENIIYWSKYTGAIPTNVQMSELSFNRGAPDEGMQTSVNFAYYYHEHMEANILIDFNYNSLGYTTMNTYVANSPRYNALYPCDIFQTVPIYDSDTFLGKNYMGRPVIFYINDTSDQPILKLRWLP